MENITLELDEAVMTRLKSLQKEGESIQETITRIILTYYPVVDKVEWEKASDSVFDEFETTFQKLAE